MSRVLPRSAAYCQPHRRRKVNIITETKQSEEGTEQNSRKYDRPSLSFITASKFFVVVVIPRTTLDLATIRMGLRNLLLLEHPAKCLFRVVCMRLCVGRKMNIGVLFLLAQ